MTTLTHCTDTLLHTWSVSGNALVWRSAPWQAAPWSDTAVRCVRVCIWARLSTVWWQRLDSSNLASFSTSCLTYRMICCIHLGTKAAYLGCTYPVQQSFINSTLSLALAKNHHLTLSGQGLHPGRNTFSELLSRTQSMQSRWYERTWQSFILQTYMGGKMQK